MITLYYISRLQKGTTTSFNQIEKKHAYVWQILWKLGNIWNTYKRPRTNVAANNKNLTKVLTYFANILGIDLSVGKVIKISKLMDKLVDCREDDVVFNSILNIGRDFDEGLLHLDVDKKKL